MDLNYKQLLIAVIPVVFCAFANGDFATSVARLDLAVGDSVLLGGSNPQRHVIEETYQAALIAANQ
jgi:hypothetical protein